MNQFKLKDLGYKFISKDVTINIYQHHINEQMSYKQNVYRIVQGLVVS